MDTNKYKITEEEKEIFDIPQYSDKRYKESLKDLLNASGANVDTLCKYLGGSLDLVNRYIYREAEIPVDRLPRIAKFFGVEPSYFLEYRIDLLFKRLEVNPKLINIFLELSNKGEVSTREESTISEYTITPLKRDMYMVPQYSQDVFSNSLKVLIRAAGASPGNLSEGTGIPLDVILGLLSGFPKVPKIEIIKRISNFFNISPSYFSEYLFIYLYELVKIKPEIIDDIININKETTREIEKGIRDSQEIENQQVDLQPIKSNYMNVKNMN